jgi:quercetin dioxygenase-like cupin family protein
MSTQPRPAAKAPDAVTADPKHYKVEVENDKVRVLRVKYGPKEKSVMHSHPASIGVFLNDCAARFKYPDGKSEDINVKAGQALYFDAFTHHPESLSDKPFELILIELKG